MSNIQVLDSRELDDGGLEVIISFDKDGRNLLLNAGFNSILKDSLDLLDKPSEANTDMIIE